MSATDLRRLAVGGFVLLFLFKLWLAARLPLFGDEAFYWLESRHLAPAFDDVPAATPWLIALGSALFGDGTLALRLPFLLLAVATVWLLWRLARALLDPAAAWAALLVLAAIPLFAQNGLLALPDVPLNFALALCLLGLQRCQADARSGPYWLAAGCAVGWLSHYRFLVPLGAAGLALLALPEGRALLRRRSVLVAGAFGNGFGLVPLLWQQWQSHGAGLWFQYGERHPWRFQPQLLGDPLLQALLTSPLLYVLLLCAGLRALRGERGSPVRLLAATGLAIVLVYFLLGPFVDSERSRLHWPLPGYLALAIPLAAAWPRWRRPLGFAWLLSGMLLLSGAAYLGVLAVAPQRLSAGAAYPANIAGWDAIAAATREQLAALPAGSTVVADNFMLAAELQFALGRPVYSLDHPLNRKHGRQGELARMGLDEARIPPASVAAPRLLVSELGGARLRARAPWYARLCAHFPRARPLAERMVDDGRKRVLWWLDRGRADERCLPPVLAYVDRSGWPLALAAGEQVDGWALRGEVGIRGLRGWLGDTPLALEYGIPLPTLDAQIGGSGDPSSPALGFRFRVPDAAAPGRTTLRLEALVDDHWNEVLRMPVQWR